MRCENCPLATDEPCDYFDEHGIEFKDGTIGCYMPKNKVLKIDSMHNDYYGEMCTDMGMEMDAKLLGIEIKDIVAVCEHMIGLDNVKPYKRHGKLFYKPYRNYYDAPPKGNKFLDAMHSVLITRTQRSPEDDLWYTLTRQGLDWLGRQINTTIYDYK